MRFLKHLIGMAGVVWLAMTLSFFLLRVLPGDAITSEMMQGGANAEEIAAQRALFGLDAPLFTQYLRFLAGTLTGDLGYSLTSRESVSLILARNAWPTLSLGLSALGLASLFGVGLGLLSSLQLPFKLAQLLRFIIHLSLSLPVYWTGTLAIFVFTVLLGWLPAGGDGTLNQLLLPAAILGFHTAGAIARVTQVNIQQLMGASFVRTARAKGLPERVILWRHIFRAGLSPIIAVIALQAGFLLSGTVIIESLFVRSGLGRVLLKATLEQDYPVVQGVVILSALTYAGLNLLADAVSAWLDPRVSL